MKTTLLKQFACISALSLASFLVYAGGTNSSGDASTGYKNAPDRSLEQGDMGATGTAQSPATPVDSSAQPQTQVDDTTLAKHVKDAIKNDAMLKKLDIDVKANDGKVTLSGDAKDIRWQARALMVANSITGVKAVQNNLTVGSGKK